MLRHSPEISALSPQLSLQNGRSYHELCFKSWVVWCVQPWNIPHSGGMCFLWIGKVSIQVEVIGNCVCVHVVYSAYLWLSLPLSLPLLLSSSLPLSLPLFLSLSPIGITHHWPCHYQIISTIIIRHYLYQYHSHCHCHFLWFIVWCVHGMCCMGLHSHLW